MPSLIDMEPVLDRVIRIPVSMRDCQIWHATADRMSFLQHFLQPETKNCMNESCRAQIIFFKHDLREHQEGMMKRGLPA